LKKKNLKNRTVFLLEEMDCTEEFDCLIAKHHSFIIPQKWAMLNKLRSAARGSRRDATAFIWST